MSTVSEISNGVVPYCAVSDKKTGVSWLSILFIASIWIQNSGFFVDRERLGIYSPFLQSCFPLLLGHDSKRLASKFLTWADIPQESMRIVIVSSSTIDIFYQIYTFYQNRYQIYIFYQNSYQIYIFYENRYQIYTKFRYQNRYQIS